MQLGLLYFFTSPYSLDNKIEIHQNTTLHCHVQSYIKCMVLRVEIETLIAYS